MSAKKITSIFSVFLDAIFNIDQIQSITISFILTTLAKLQSGSSLDLSRTSMTESSDWLILGGSPNTRAFEQFWLANKKIFFLEFHHLSWNWRTCNHVVPILTFRKEETTRELSYFSLMSTFSTPQSID